MLKPRTALFVLAGVFLFLVASLDRSQRASDCNAMADLLTEQIHAIDAGLDSSPIADAKRNRMGLVEVASSLTRLQSSLDGMSLSSNAMKKSRAEIAREVEKMQEAVNAMANQNVPPPLVVTARDVNTPPLLGASAEKILADYAATRAHLTELVGDAERACVE